LRSRSFAGIGIPKLELGNKKNEPEKYRDAGFTMPTDEIVIVSGLPRSGTSMLMKMLEAGGIPPLTDHIRTPDEDNPKGYYEFERVKQLESDKEWLPEARGKAVKIISFLLPHLPPGFQYRVLFLRREVTEVLASQRQMLIRRGEEPDKTPDERMAMLYGKHLSQVETWLANQADTETVYLHHHEVIANPAVAAETINEFLGGAMDVSAMTTVVDPSLHRQRV
jgi:hypothetical protein